MEYSIGKAAEAVGLSTYTLRYYEKEGLLPEVKRNSNGVRVYDDSDIFWIDLIKCLKDTGMSMTEIKSIVELSLKGDSTINDRREILVNHKKTVELKIEELNKSIEKINKKLDWYDGKESSC
ncbi:MerR family transcriptional regulator [Clostridium sp.]|uniref:MerR family transcriptional regulator n=1 Tax=Clostridium sp. TaxID=1506 RepID=UPI003F2B06E7